MPASTDLARISLVPEAVVGQAPAAPQYKEMRITGESVTLALSHTASNELGGTGRGTRDSILTGAQSQGAINFEMHKDPALEDLFAGMLASNWGSDPLSIGMTGGDYVYVSTAMKTFTMEKRWQDEAGDYTYDKYHGLTPNTMTLTVAPNTPITGSFAMLGTSLDLDLAEDTGSAYAAAPSYPVMTAPLVTSISLYDQDGDRVLDVGTTCFTNLVITLNNNDRGIQCIGHLGTRATVLGKVTGTITYTLLYGSQFMQQAVQDQADFKLVVEMRDAPGNYYVLTFPRVRITEANVEATGTNQDLNVDGSMDILVGTAPNQYSVLIQRGAPGPVTVLANTAGDHQSATISFAGGPSDDDDAATVTLTLTGSTIAPVTVPIAAGDDKYEVASNVAQALNGPNLTATANREVVNLAPHGTTTGITNVSVTIA